MDCEGKLSNGFIRRCGHRPKQGIRRKWYGNWDDVDRVATQYANKGTKITKLVLKQDAKLYEAQGNNKTSKGGHVLSLLDFGNGYIHTDNFTILYRGEDERENIQELVEGGRVFTIIEPELCNRISVIDFRLDYY